jgi:hypothetical protein
MTATHYFGMMAWLHPGPAGFGEPLVDVAIGEYAWR